MNFIIIIMNLNKVIVGINTLKSITLHQMEPSNIGKLNDNIVINRFLRLYYS